MFGSVTNGTESAPTTVTITNDGAVASGPVTITPGGANAAAFVVRNSTCTGALGPMGTCQFNVVFTPMATGNLSAFLTLLANPGGGGAISLSGIGAFPPALTISPSPHDFMGVAQGTSSTAQGFTVLNNGGTTTTALSISFTGADGAMFATGTGTTCAAALAPAGRCTVNVVFTPTSTGAKVGTLTVSDTTGVTGTASLRGTGLSPASIAGPALVTFPDTLLGQPSGFVTVTLTNAGQVATPLLTLALTGTNAAEFSRDAASDTCSNTAVAPGTCTVRYRFTPAGAGLRSATLGVSGGSLTPISLRFEGVGQNPAQLQFASTALDLGSAVVGGAASTAVIGLNNSGDVASGPVTFTPAPSPEFTVSTSTCASGVPARGSCSVTVSFSAAASGLRVGTLGASASPGGSASAIMISGTGIAPGALSIAPTSRNFGSVVIGGTLGAPSQAFLVTNTGGTTLNNVSLAVVTGASASFLLTNTSGVTPCGGNLAPAAQCGGTVTFVPQFIGANGAFLRATSGTNTAQATLSGVGLRQASLTPQSPSINFGTVIVGQPSAPVPFTLVNDGDVASGPVTLSFAPSNGFSWDAGSCAPGVDAGLSCSGSVVFQPPVAGSVSSTVTVGATPGGGQTFTANANGITPATLTLAPEAGSSANYGNVLLGTTASMRFTVTNTGQQASGPLSLGLSGTNGSQWQVATGTSDCQLGQSLPGGGSCTSGVRFTASTTLGAGAKSGVLTASASPGTSPTLTLTANVQTPAQLASIDTSNSFGGQEVGVASTVFSWVIRNTGDVASGVPSVSNTNTTDFVTSGCTTAIPAGGTCTLSVTFRPQAGGARSGVITVSATPGNNVTLNVDGRGQWRLTVSANVANTLGSVGTTDSVITGCGSPGCSALYDHNVSVTVRASNVALSGYHFSAYSLPTTCNGFGNGRDCTVTMDGPKSATASFLPTSENLVFVTSTTYPATLGSTAAYDTKCNEVATAAGLNNANGTGYLAWISTDTSTVLSRLGTTRGAYRRVDNVLFASSSSSLLSQRSMSPPVLDEYGKFVSADFWSGTYGNGASNSANDCTNWTSTAGTTEYGVTFAGPGRWSNAYSGKSCGAVARLVCLGITSTTTVLNPPVPSSGKVTYLSTATITPSTMGAGLNSLDALCSNNKPPTYASRTFVAFAASGSQAAAARILAASQATKYYRLDGMQVGTGLDLINGSLSNGIWVYNDGSYAIGNVPTWTGAGSPSSTPLATTCCSNWTTAGVTGNIGFTSFITGFFSQSSSACTQPRTVICVEP